MSTETEWDKEYALSNGQPKRGFNWLMGCGLGCGVMMLVCCGGATIIAYGTIRTFEDSLTDDPDEILALSEQIATFDRPADLAPQGGFDFDTSLLWQPIEVKGALYESQASEGIFVLVEFGEMFDDNTVDYLRSQIQKAIREEDDLESRIRIDGEPEEITLTIRGEETTFTFNRGTELESDRQFIQAAGRFPGHDGRIGFVMLVLPADEYDEQQIVELIESIE